MRAQLLILLTCAAYACGPICPDEDGRTVIWLDSGHPNAGPKGEAEFLRICDGHREAYGNTFTVPVQRILGNLEIDALGATIAFPNLLSVDAVAATENHLIFGALEVASSFWVQGVMLDAPALASLEEIHADATHFAMPTLTSIGYVWMDYGSISIPSLERAESLDLGRLEGAVVLDSLRDAGTIGIWSTELDALELPSLAHADGLYMAHNKALSSVKLPQLSNLAILHAEDNPSLKDCDLRALAVQAGVPADSVALSGNSPAPCN